MQKTVVVGFTFAEDGSLRLEMKRIRDGTRRPMVFKYKHTELAVSDLFDYLGVRAHWREGPGTAWQERDMKGTQALGAVKGALRWTPFLPFARTVSVGESLVGGAYLYSSDLWAAYVDQRKQALGGKYLTCLFISKRLARTAQLVGCLSVIWI